MQYIFLVKRTPFKPELLYLCVQNDSVTDVAFLSISQKTLYGIVVASNLLMLFGPVADCETFFECTRFDFKTYRVYL